MREGGQAQRPVIVVLSVGADAVTREVLAGIEEEGVPAVEPPVPDRGMAAVDLASRAAAQSPLQVGVGIGAAGEVGVCHARLGAPVFVVPAGASAAAARTVGHNAARIVVGIPLRTLP